MRIAICDYSGHPFQLELSRRLAHRGHDILHLHFAEFQTPKAALATRPDDAGTFTVEGISLGQAFSKDRFLSRRSQEIQVGEAMASRVSKYRADIVIGCNMPLDAQNRLQKACAKNGAAFVFWLQDLYSVAIHHYLGRRFGPFGRMIGRYYQHIEGRILRASDMVVAISEAFVAPLQRWGVASKQITVIPNWAPLSEIYPVGKGNEWARRHGLADKMVALYTGTLGLKHDPGLLLQLARAGEAKGLWVVVASEGAAADRLARDAHKLSVDNLVVLPFQPMQLYPQLLGAGDVMLAMIGDEASAFSVPSKILSYLAAGKPIIAAIPSDNDAAKTINDACAGFVTAPGDLTLFIDRVLAVALDKELRATLGNNGRAFAENRFAIEAIADQFEALLTDALNRRHGTNRTVRAAAKSHDPTRVPKKSSRIVSK